MLERPTAMRLVVFLPPGVVAVVGDHGRSCMGFNHYIKEHIHWLPISTRIEYKVLLIVLKAQMGVAPKYLRDAIRVPTSATSLRPLRSMDRRELYVPRTRTTMAMSRSFALIAPSLWNRLPPSARASLLSSNLSTSLSLLKTCLFSWS